MIIRNTCYTTNKWRNDIGGIQSTTNAHFKNGNIHFLFQKNFECYECQETKIGCHGWKKFILFLVTLHYQITLVVSSFSQHSQKCLLKSALEMGTPLIRIRSRTSNMCGLVYRPVFKPVVRKMLSHMAQVEPFPLVPATCIMRNSEI